MGLVGGDVGQHRNDAAAAQGQEGKHFIVVARKHAEVLIEQTGGGGDIGDVAAGFLDAHDVFVVGQLLQHIQRNGAAGAGGHIVKQDGDVDPVGNGAEMGQHTAFVGFVIVGGDHQQTIGSHGLIAAGQGGGMKGVVGTGAHDHRNASGHFADDGLGDFVFLLLGEGGGFGCGTQGHNAVGVVLQLKLHQSFQLLVIYLTVRAEGGGQSHQRAAEGAQGLGHMIGLLSSIRWR